MKRLLSLLLFTCVWLSAQSAARYTLAPAGQEDPGSKRAREIVERTVQALGGDAYIKAPTYFYTGRSSGFSKGELNALGDVIVWINGDKQRIERPKVPGWVTIFNGDKGWDITYHGTEQLDPKVLQQHDRIVTYSLASIFRKWTRDPRTIYFFDGDRFAEAKQCFSVTMINGDNQSATLLVDQQTYLPVKETWSARDPEYHDKFEESIIFDKYRLIQGIQNPFIISRYKNGEMTSETFINDAKYLSVPDEIFTADYKKPAPR